MKIKQKEKQFIPIEITLETQKEVDLMWAILNTGSIDDGVFKDAWAELAPYTINHRQEHEKLLMRLGK